MSLLDRVHNVLGLAPACRKASAWPLGFVALLVPVLIWFASTNIVRSGPGEAGPEADAPAAAEPAELPAPDEVTRQLARIVELEERRLARQQGLYRKGLLSDAEVDEQELKVAEAKLRLAQRLEEVASQREGLREPTVRTRPDGSLPRDEVTRQLQRIVELEERRFARRQDLSRKRLLSDAEVDGQKLKVAEAKLRLARRLEHLAVQRKKIRQPATRPAEKDEQSRWSKAVGGLAGRLVVPKRRITTSEYFDATLQLKNVGASPLAVQTQNPFALRVEVKDAAGSLVKPTSQRCDVLTSAQWTTVAPGASTSFQVGFEAKDGGKGSHLDTITDLWKLSPGKYTLLGTYTSKGFFKDLRGQRPQNVWEGEIALPPVEVEVAVEPASPGEAAAPTAVSLKQLWARNHLQHQFEAQGIFMRGGHVYVGQGGPPAEARVAKVEMATGKVAWSYPTGHGYQPSYPASNGKVVIFGTYYEKFVVGLDDATGKELWKIPTADQNMSAAAFSGDLAFIGSYDKHLHAIDWAAGKETWKTRLGAPIWSVPCVAGKLVLVGCYDGCLYGLEQASGNIVMKVDCGGRIDSDPVVANGLVLLAVDDQDYAGRYDASKVRRTIVAIDIGERKIVSRIAAEDSLARKPIVSGDHAYFFGRIPLYAYDAKNRRLAWSVKKWPKVLACPLVFEKIIVLPMNELGKEGQHTTNITVLDRATGRELFTSDAGGIGAREAAYVQHGDLLLTTAYQLAVLYSRQDRAAWERFARKLRRAFPKNERIASWVDEAMKAAADRPATPPATQSAEAELRTWAKAVRAALPAWQVVQCDRQPTVSVGEHRGYRMLLRQGRRQYAGPMPAGEVFPKRPAKPGEGQFVTLYSHVDLVLFPADAELPRDVCEKIPWREVEQEWFVRPVEMGKGSGFRWFARTTLYWQEWLREKLKLQGGDDRIALLTEGLFVEDKGSNTANSVMGLLKQHGEKAVPYIEAAIKKHADKDPWKAVHALAFIPGDRSDGLLRSLYASENEKLSGAAAYALIHPPYRQAAREAYLDMLRRQTYVYQAAEACVEFQWKEAVPILREICEKPASWGRFRGALEAKRRLEGRPVPEDMRQAEQTIRSVTGGASPPDDRALDKAKRLLMESPDKEAATVAAVALAVHVAMASHAKVERVRRAGREILRTLPAEDVRKLLKTLLAGMKDKDEGYWREYAELLRWLDAAQPALPRSSDGGPKGVPAPAAERKQ